MYITTADFDFDLIVLNSNVSQIVESLLRIYGAIDYLWTDNIKTVVCFVPVELRTYESEASVVNYIDTLRAKCGCDLYIATSVQPPCHPEIDTSLYDSYATHAYYDKLLRGASGTYGAYLFNESSLDTYTRSEDALIPQLGVLHTTWADIAEEYAFNDRREKLLEDARWVCAYAQWLFGGLNRIWVGGSFVSSKSEPDDIDIALHVDAELFARVWNYADKRKRIEQLANHKSLEQLGLNAHVFLVQDGPDNKGVFKEPFFVHPPQAFQGYLYVLFSSLQRKEPKASNQQFDMARGFLEMPC